MLWLYILLAIIFAFILLIIFRALMFKPYTQAFYPTEDYELDLDGILERFSQILQCKTISNRDVSLVDLKEFEKAQALIRKFYPNIFKVCDFEKVLDTGLLFRWPGKDPNNPIVLMSHYDVVPVDEEQWKEPPFSGLIKDGEIWGRGTLDTKGTFVSILEATEYMIKSGFKPENDIYLSFAGDEEVAGPTCPAIVEVFRERNLVPQMVLDEGGAVVDRVFPGVNKPCALVGIAEKGITDIKMSITSKGGHASAPPPSTSLGDLCKAVVKIQNKPFKFVMSPATKQMFDILGRHSSFVYRIIFANMWAFSFLIDLMAKKSGGEMNALLRTTMAFTMAKGSDSPNVMPSSAYVIANLRLMRENPYDQAIEHMKKAANDDNITFEAIHASNASIYSDTSSKAWDMIQKAIGQTWPSAITSPYLMFAASDSRHFCKITDKVYKFSAMHMTSEERSYIHGHNERIKIEDLDKMVKFFIRIISQS